MNGSTRLIIGGILAVATLGLFGYTYYIERQDRLAAEERADALAWDASQLRSTIASYESDFFFTLTDLESEELLEQIVTTDDWAARTELIEKLTERLGENFVEYGTSQRYSADFEALAVSNDQADRARIRDDVVERASDEIVLEAPVIVGDPIFDPKLISSWVTAITALGSGIGSIVMFITRRGRRRVDEDLAEIELEKAKIELAQMRYDAREALTHVEI
ncbi:MAG: hypothetical protein AAGF13_09800 [Pseudomonadota bacterium]